MFVLTLNRKNLFGSDSFLKVPIVVLLAERSKLSPRLHLPEVPGGILMQVAGPPVYGKEGFRFTTWTYDLAFYAHRAGEHPVAPILVQAELPEGGRRGHGMTLAPNPSSFTLAYQKRRKGSRH